MRLRFAHAAVIALLCAAGLAGCRSTGTAYNPPLGVFKLYLLVYNNPASTVEVFRLPVTSASTPAFDMATSGGCTSPALGLFMDKQGRLFVPDCATPFDVTSLYTQPLSATSTPAYTLTDAQQENTTTAEDSSGNIYQALCMGYIDVFNGPVTASRATPSVSDNVGGCPWGIAVAPNGNLYVSGTSSVEQFSLPLTASSTPSAATASNFDNEGLAVDSSNRIFVANQSASGVINVYTQPFTSASTPAFGITLTSGTSVLYLAFDGSGNLWADDASGGLWEIPAPITSSSAATKILTVSGTPGGIAFGP